MKTICIVDDDDMYKFIFRKGLELSGIPIPMLEFNDGIDAMEHFKTVDDEHIIPEVILLDINMLDMDGWEFLTAFDHVRSKLEKNVDIYIVTNSMMKKDYERAKEITNVVGYLLKPIPMTTIKEILQ